MKYIALLILTTTLISISDIAWAQHGYHKMISASFDKEYYAPGEVAELTLLFTNVAYPNVNPSKSCTADFTTGLDLKLNYMSEDTSVDCQLVRREDNIYEVKAKYRVPLAPDDLVIMLKSITYKSENDTVERDTFHFHPEGLDILKVRFRIVNNKESLKIADIVIPQTMKASKDLIFSISINNPKNLPLYGMEVEYEKNAKNAFESWGPDGQPKWICDSRYDWGSDFLLMGPSEYSIPFEVRSSRGLTIFNARASGQDVTRSCDGHAKAIRLTKIKVYTNPIVYFELNVPRRYNKVIRVEK